MNYQRFNPPDESDAKRGGIVPAAQAVPVARDPYKSAVGTYGYGYGAETPSGFETHLREYLRILIKHRWLISSIVAAAVVFGAVTTLMQTPLYTSTVRLQIDRTADKIVQSGNVASEGNDDDLFMQTQYELLQSRTMAERVASALQLGDDPAFFDRENFPLLDLS